MMTVASTNEFDIAVISIVLPMVVAIVWIIAHQWRKTRVAAYNARLKQLMIERGMSASEIRSVLEAGTEPNDRERHGRQSGCC